MGRGEVVVLGALGGLTLLLAPAALEAQGRRAGLVGCQNHLRQLGLAAIQYADDKRFFPHVGPIRELDGGYTTNTSTKVARALLWFGYHDDPERFVCPEAKDDEALEVLRPARENMRRWFWAQDQEKASVTRSPFVDGAADPALRETGELSYGWTRRGLNSNVRSAALLAADRTRANHGDGWSVLQADATVDLRREEAALAAALVATEGQSAGYLGIQGPDDPPPAVAGGPPGPPPAWAGRHADATVSLTLEARRGGKFQGELVVDGAAFPVRGADRGGRLEGSFVADGETYTFTAALDGGALVLTSGRRTYRLARR
ncbi:MAG: hypothetical protein KF878_13205 [Planctomycetes bacterium]|nr:hypothetical protein [Planctomycetota bacterium]